MAFILTLGCLFLIYIYNLCQLVGPSLKFEWNRLVSPRFEWTLKFERSPRFEGITLRSPRIECFTYFWGWSSTYLWRHHHENIFSCIIWDDLSKSDVKLKLHWIFQKISKWRNFRAVANFFVGNVTGSWAPYQESQEHALHFELLIDILA